jgi:Glycosyltransferase
MDYYGLPEERIRVINNGVDLENFESEWSFGNKILFVGHMVSRKGPDRLLDAFKILSSKFSDLELVYVGSGRMKEDLVREVNDSELQDKVSFKKGISDRELVDLYSESVFCLPSGYEGFGMVYVEAMAAGAPVLATEGTAIEEVIEDGENGLMTSREPEDIAQKLEKIIEDQELSIRSVKQLRDFSRFDWSRIAEETESYYREVLED